MKSGRSAWALAEVVGALFVLSLAAGAVLAGAVGLADCAQERRAAAAASSYSSASWAWLRYGGEAARDPGRHPLREAVRVEAPAVAPGSVLMRGGLEIRAWSRPALGPGVVARAWSCGPATRATRRRLAAPGFRYAGAIADVEFPLRDLLLPNPANPPGTIYRFTTDGTDPQPSSPVWNPAMTFPLWPFPAEIRAAAFPPDERFEVSAVSRTALRRRARVQIARIDGNPSTNYTLADALAPPAAHGLRVWVESAPPGTELRVTLDGSDPGGGALVTGPVSVAPSAAVVWRPHLTVRARGLGPAPIEFEDASLILFPKRVVLPTPSLRPSSGVFPSPAVVEVRADPLPPGSERTASVDDGPWFPCGGSIVLSWR